MAAYPTPGHDHGSGAYDCSPNDAALGKASPGTTEWEEEAHSLRDGRGQTKRRWFQLLLKLAACLLVAIVAIKAMRPNPETPTLSTSGRWHEHENEPVRDKWRRGERPDWVELQVEVQEAWEARGSQNDGGGGGGGAARHKLLRAYQNQTDLKAAARAQNLPRAGGPKAVEPDTLLARLQAALQEDMQQLVEHFGVGLGYSFTGSFRTALALGWTSGAGSALLPARTRGAMHACCRSPALEAPDACVGTAPSASPSATSSISRPAPRRARP